MRLVLVGDDGSEAAARAIDWALRFAGERGAEATAVQASRARTDRAPDARLTWLSVPDAHPASAIIETADRLDADLVVLGRRGAGGFPSMPMGTTAHVVAAASRRPVVIVPAGDRSGSEPLVQRVVVGLDGLPGSAEAAAWASRTCPAAAFTAVHALELAPAFAGTGDDADALYEQARTRAGALMRDSWSRPFAEAGIEPDVVIDEGGPAEVLLNTAVSAGADLIVVGRRDHQSLRGTLGSVSQRVLAYAPCPAVLVPLPL
jgi:nucleotide-binding universal stress UspA family protein